MAHRARESRWRAKQKRCPRPEKITLFAAGVASQRFMTGLEEQQEIMADLADMISQVYALESALLRARKLAAAGRSSAEVAAAMTALLADETMALAEQAARRVLAACGEGDALHDATGHSAAAGALHSGRCRGIEPHRRPACHRAGTLPCLKPIFDSLLVLQYEGYFFMGTYRGHFSRTEPAQRAKDGSPRRKPGG